MATGINDYGMIVGSKADVERIISDYGGSNFFDKSRQLLNTQESDALNTSVLQEREALKSLQTNYEKQTLDDYKSMLNASSAINQANVFSGYKQRMLEANKENYDTVLANAYQTYLANRSKTMSEYAEEQDDISAAYDKARQNINAAEAKSVSAAENYFSMLPSYLNGMQEYYASLSDEQKRRALGLNDIDELPADIVSEYYAKHPVYGQYITDGMWNIPDYTESGITDTEYTNMYRNLFGLKLGNYTFDNWLYQQDRDLYNKLSEEIYTGAGSLRDLLEASYGGGTPQSNEEAFKTELAVRKSAIETIENDTEDYSQRMDKLKDLLGTYNVVDKDLTAYVAKSKEYEKQIKDLQDKFKQLEFAMASGTLDPLDTDYAFETRDISDKLKKLKQEYNDYTEEMYNKLKTKLLK